MAKGSNPRIHIIPTVFSTDLKGFKRRLARLEKASPEIQIDIMDGKFVKAKSIPVENIPDLRKKRARFEAHLMMKEPVSLVPALKKKGFDRVIAHIEALNGKKGVDTYIQECRKNKIDAGLAIRPETPVSRVKPYLRRIEVLLFLGVHPGKEGQHLIPGVVRKIASYTEHGYKTSAQIDGGVSLKTAQALAEAGVRRFNTGAYTAKARSPKRAITALKNSIL